MMVERALTSSPREAADSPAGSNAAAASRSIVSRPARSRVSRPIRPVPAGAGRELGRLRHARQEVLSARPGARRRPRWPGVPGGRPRRAGRERRDGWAGPAATGRAGRRAPAGSPRPGRRAATGGPQTRPGERPARPAPSRSGDGRRRWSAARGEGRQERGRLVAGADPELMADPVGRARPGVGRSASRPGARQGGAGAVCGSAVRPGRRPGWCWRASPRGAAGGPAWAHPSCARGAARRPRARRPPGAAGPARRWRAGLPLRVRPGHAVHGHRGLPRPAPARRHAARRPASLAAAR